MRAGIAARVARLSLRAGLVGRALGPALDLACEAGWRRSLEHLPLARPRARRDGADPAVYGPIWRSAAATLDAQVRDLGDGFLEIRSGHHRARVWRNLVELDDPVTLRLVGDKPAVHRLLSEADLPVPDFVTADRSDLSAAAEFVARSDAPCVVKPAFGTGRGMGVTCGVATVSDLHRGAVWAGRWGDSLLIEGQARGCEYRVLMLDGEILDVVRRRPPHVTGDGRSTVAELIDAENERRRSRAGQHGLFAIRIDLDCLLALRAAGLTLGSVPRPGAEVTVKHAANENGPEDNESMPGAVGPAFAADMRTAVDALGARLASVEVVTSELDRSLRQAGGSIIEVNTTPGLHYHYQVADPERAIPVAVPILRAVLAAEGPGG